ncbi:MAG: hemerythrin domain-containing protein [Phycisphaerales bacterium]|nr:hemerythrin domain-containing protein [Phycisphaerales bacterium]
MNHDPKATPSAVLREEHQIILRVLHVLAKLVERSESGQGFEFEALNKCVEFFRLFADACHHAKEEDLLFPVLEARGIPKDNGPIGVMLYEHNIARELTRQMGGALESMKPGDDTMPPEFREAAHQYINLLSAHIHKEDNVLFMMGDRVMKSEDQESLCAQFCEVGCRQFEGKKVEQLEAIATDLEAKWLVE